MLLELFGVVFGFIYLYLEIVQKKGMWLVGFLMAAVYTVAPDFIPGTIDDATLNAAITFVDVLLQKKKD